MSSRAHPLRRSYAFQLALGLPCALLAAWVLIARDPGGRGRSEPRAAALEGPEPFPLRAPSPGPPPAAEPAGWAAREAAVSVPEDEPPPALHAPPAAPPPGELVVLVLDAHGRPASGVRLRLELESDPPTRTPGRFLPPTDELGRTRFPLAWFEPPAGLARHAFVLCTSIPQLAAPSIDFGATRPAPGLVTLVLPPGGRVRVRVLDEDELPVPGQVSLYAAIEDARGGVTTASESVRAGWAEFSDIGLDSVLELRVSYDDQRGPTRRLTVPGPSFVGETVECTLRIAPEWPLLRFRALDERGLPLANASLALRVSLEPLSPQVGRTVTNAEGRVELRLMTSHVASEERRMELTHSGPLPRGAEVGLPFELARREPTDLGDVVLRPWAVGR